MDKVGVFYIEEDSGMWNVHLSSSYPVNIPERESFSSFQQAYDWADINRPIGEVRRGALHGMFYIYA